MSLLFKPQNEAPRVSIARAAARLAQAERELAQAYIEVARAEVHVERATADLRAVAKQGK